MSPASKLSLADRNNTPFSLGQMPPSEKARRLKQLCITLRLHMSRQRDVVIQVLSEMDDHPDSREIHRRACAIDPKISVATIYRTLSIFERAGVVTRHDFGGEAGRYELASGRHHHMVDRSSGRIIDFEDKAFDALLKRVAAEMGYDLVDYRLELYGEPEGPPGISSRG